MELIDKILGLKELGYSKAEIDALISGIKKEEEKQAPKEAEVIYNIDDEEPIQKETNVEENDTINRLKNIEETLKALQSNNIKWSNLPTQKEKTELEIVQEILGGSKNNGNE